MRATRRGGFGWSAVALSTVIAALWAFWGAIENFHEGWYHDTWRDNLLMMFGQYLSPALTFVLAAALGIASGWLGALAHLSIAALAVWRFEGASPWVIYPWIVGPLALLAAGYGYGRPRPRRWALRLVVGLPALVWIGFSIEPALRVAGRHDDGDRGARLLAAGERQLRWAPQGPGWPSDGASWEEARRVCAHLDSTGTRLLAEPLGLWRLPTVEEAVTSMHRGGRPAGGRWDAARRRPEYDRRPDKETPLWDPRSKVIYWWTATEVDSTHAWIVVYDGKTWPRDKKVRYGYLAFRAVRDSDGR